MKILQRNAIAPFQALSGDTVTVSYRDEYGVKHDLCQEVVAHAMTVDVVAVTEHERVEALGMKRAIAGWFGEAS